MVSCTFVIFPCYTLIHYIDEFVATICLIVSCAGKMTLAGSHMLILIKLIATITMDDQLANEMERKKWHYFLLTNGAMDSWMLRQQADYDRDIQRWTYVPVTVMCDVKLHQLARVRIFNSCKDQVTGPMRIWQNNIYAYLVKNIFFERFVKIS